MNYLNYLKSESWRRWRAGARKRDRNRCRVCGTSVALHTHHKTYRNLGNERPADLVMLCASHHKACHAFIKSWTGKRLSSYSLTMKYIARERKKLRGAK